MASATPNTKRKREDDDEQSCPVAGPSMPAPSASASRVIGPALPPHLIGSNTVSDTEENQPADKKGPGGDDGNQDDDTSEDDDFGPQLPPAPGTQAAKHNTEANSAAWDDSPDRNRSNNSGQEEASSRPERDEWMVVPPTKGAWASGTTGAPLQSRKFTTGRAARSSAATDGGAAAAWTEDPSAKRLRLENEVLGIQPQTTSTVEKRPQPERNSEATAKKLKEIRGQEKKPSLLETHKQRHKAEEDDPSARPFDREKDIAGPATISNASRREMLNRASDYTSRFSGGKYL